MLSGMHDPEMGKVQTLHRLVHRFGYFRSFAEFALNSIEVDADGKPYDGANKYVMHFDKGEMPPAQVFWSLTMYDAEYFFVPNKINRYTLSSRNKFKTNPDGSTDLNIQNQSPGKDKESNWLPAPAGKFILMLWLYWPKEKDPSIINGTWNPPAVKMVQ